MLLPVRLPRLAAVVLVAGLGLGAVACSSDKGADPGTAKTTATEDSSATGASSTSVTAAGGAERDLTAKEQEYLDAALAGMAGVSVFKGLDMPCAMERVVVIMGEDRLLASGTPQDFASAGYSNVSLTGQDAKDLAAAFVRCGFSVDTLLSTMSGSEEYQACVRKTLTEADVASFLEASFTQDTTISDGLDAKVKDACGSVADAGGVGETPTTAGG